MGTQWGTSSQHVTVPVNLVFLHLQEIQLNLKSTMYSSHTYDGDKTAAYGYPVLLHHNLFSCKGC